MTKEKKRKEPIEISPLESNYGLVQGDIFSFNGRFLQKKSHFLQGILLFFESMVLSK